MPATPKILIVNDDASMQIFLINLLTSAGYDAIGIGNRIDGLNMARTLSPALIVLDVMMPDDGGIHLYRNLKLDHLLKHIPVIMLSGLDRNLFFHYQTFQCHQTGLGLPQPEAYLEKPPEAGTLVDLIRDLLAGLPVSGIVTT
ncbi:MAG: response regulator [Desulfatirhabdiaceae bacterium]